MIVEKCDQSDEETWADEHKDKERAMIKDNEKDMALANNKIRQRQRHLERPQGIVITFETFCLTPQLRVTL